MAITDAAKFLVNNYIDRSTTTFSSPHTIEAALGNLQRFDWRLEARLSGTTVHYLIHLDSALPVDAFAIKGTNLRNGASVALQYGSIDNGTLIDTTAAEMFYLAPTLYPNGLPHYYAHGTFLTAPITKQHWRIRLSDPGHPAGALTLGRAYIGPSLELTRSDGQPLPIPLASPHRLVDPTAIERSPAGSPHVDRLSLWKESVFDLLYMTEEDAVIFEEIQHQFGHSVPIWFFPYPTNLALRYRKAIYGLFQTLADLTPSLPGVFNASQITLSEV